MHKTRNKHGPDTDVGIRRTLARAAEVIAGQPPPWMEIRYGPPCSAASRGDPPGERWRSGKGYAGMRPLVPKSPGPLVPQKERQCELRAAPPGIPEGQKRRRSDEVYSGLRPLVPKSPGLLVSQVERQCLLRAAPRDFVTLRQPDESPPGIVKRLIVNNIDSSARSKLPARGRLKHGVLKDIYWLTATTMHCCESKKDFGMEYLEIKTRGEGEPGTRGVGKLADLKCDSPKQVWRLRFSKANLIGVKKMDVKCCDCMVSFRWLSEPLDLRLEQMMDQEIRWLSLPECLLQTGVVETNRIDGVETNRIDGVETNRIEEMNIGLPAPAVSTSLDHRLEQMMDQEIRWLSEVETNRIDGVEANRIEEMNIGQPAPTVSFRWLSEPLDHRLEQMTDQKFRWLSLPECLLQTGVVETNRIDGVEANRIKDIEIRWWSGSNPFSHWYYWDNRLEIRN